MGICYKNNDETNIEFLNPPENNINIYNNNINDFINKSSEHEKDNQNNKSNINYSEFSNHINDSKNKSKDNNKNDLYKRTINNEEININFIINDTKELNLIVNKESTFEEVINQLNEKYNLFNDYEYISFYINNKQINNFSLTLNELEINNNDKIEINTK